MQSYRVREIGDFAEIDHGHAFEGDFFVDDPTGLVVVTPGNFRIGGGFKKDSLKWYSEDGPIPDGYVMSSGDLIVTMTDLSQSADTLGYAAQVPNDEYTYLHNQRIGLVRTGDRISDGYLHYAMRTRQYRQQVVASSSGSTVHHSSPSRILECEIPVPPLPVQHRIADILGALDDKIELNRRMNETLEAMAQALYRHWFVDFGPFQDREFKDTEELGPIPVGWETQKVKEFGKVVLGSTPSTKDEENYGSEYPFIKIPDMHGQVFVDETENYLSEKGAQSQHKRFLPPDSVVVSCIATPGLVTLTSQKSQTNQQINSVIPNDGALREYLYLTFDHQSHRIKRLASGGTATAILNKTDFSNVELLSPPSDVIEAFHDKCSVWFDLMKNNLAENQTLAKTRDYLLPKLISGEIEVDAAEEAVETNV